MLERMLDKLNPEKNAVAEYKSTSETFKNAMKASFTCSDDTAKQEMQKMKAAETFADMLAIASRFDAGKESALQSTIVNAVVSTLSYFSSDANFAYYALRLKNDIVNFAVDKGFTDQLSQKPTL